ncbi:MAG: YbaK/EbsC family protein, partial [Pseudomonadota bacterium]
AERTGDAVLFITAGGNRVDPTKARALAGEVLGKADAGLVRAQTGFAIGGVAPLAHLTQPRAWFDPRLLDFAEVWAAAGTPRHVFAIAPDALRDLSRAAEADFIA